jgi:hypothetical protein
LRQIKASAGTRAQRCAVKLSQEDQNMDEDNKDRWKTFSEEIEVAGSQLVDRVTQLLKEGNVRLLRIRSENGDVFLEIPLTIGAVTGGVVALAAPWLAVLGAIAGLLARVKIEIVRQEPHDGDEGRPEDAAPDAPRDDEQPL